MMITTKAYSRNISFQVGSVQGGGNETLMVIVIKLIMADCNLQGRQEQEEQRGEEEQEEEEEEEEELVIDEFCIQ